jgi:hypothetical protein
LSGSGCGDDVLASTGDGCVVDVDEAEGKAEDRDESDDPTAVTDGRFSASALLTI